MARRSILLVLAQLGRRDSILLLEGDPEILSRRYVLEVDGLD